MSAESLQNAQIRTMSPRERLRIAQDLHETAWGIKASGLRRQYPDWTDEQINEKTRRVFQTGYAGA